MGQGVFHIFHRVFHRVGFKSKRRYVNLGIAPADLLPKGREAPGKMEENLFLCIFFRPPGHEKGTLGKEAGLSCIFI